MMPEKRTRSQIGRSNVRSGKTYERRVAHLLTEYTGHEFRRRRVEGRDLNVIERESTADVISVRDDIMYSIEVKKGKGFSFDALLGNPSRNLFTTWWHQANYDAHLLTKALNRTIYPLLFFKYTSTQDWVAIPLVIQLLLKQDVTQLPCLTYEYLDRNVTLNVSQTNKKKNHVEVTLPLYDIRFMRWKDFCETVDPKCLFFNGG